jgi:hypothetical protein
MMAVSRRSAKARPLQDPSSAFKASGVRIGTGSSGT